MLCVTAASRQPVVAKTLHHTVVAQLHTCKNTIQQARAWPARFPTEAPAAAPLRQQTTPNLSPNSLPGCRRAPSAAHLAPCLPPLSQSRYSAGGRLLSGGLPRRLPPGGGGCFCFSLFSRVYSWWGVGGGGCGNATQHGSERFGACRAASKHVVSTALHQWLHHSCIMRLYNCGTAGETRRTAPLPTG